MAFGLEVGRYDARVTYTDSTDKASRWLRRVEVRDGERTEKTVEFSSGTLIVDAEPEGGEALRQFDAYVYYYRAGEHRQPIAYTTAGAYDLRVADTRSSSREKWLSNVPVRLGGRAEVTVRFPLRHLARISHQVSSREFVRAVLARRDGRFDRKRVSYTLRIEPFVATQSSDAFTDSQQEPGEKCGLAVPSACA